MEATLKANDRIDTWETAVLYHLVHAVALLGIANLSRIPRIAAWSFVAGILIFSGTLYILSLTNFRWLGAITPIGGLAFLIGWLSLAISAGKRQEKS